MTTRERVEASLRADEMRESHRGVYPVRKPQEEREAVQKPRLRSIEVEMDTTDGLGYFPGDAPGMG